MRAKPEPGQLAAGREASGDRDAIPGPGATPEQAREWVRTRLGPLFNESINPTAADRYPVGRR